MKRIVLVVVIGLLTAAITIDASQWSARDPGLRGGDPGAGGPINGVTVGELQAWVNGLKKFLKAEGVGEGLGPRFNLDSCNGCHSQPAFGGTSPGVNSQVAVATAFGAQNILPSFVTIDGPAREARFKRKSDGTPDGGVHALFVVSGRFDGTGDATGCAIIQPDFESELARNNVIFRIPTPVFGVGLIEAIPDAAILANAEAHKSAKRKLGIYGKPHRIKIAGQPNRSGNDGTVARFGWKAQNKSLLLFAGEASNVELGISNELFQTERDETPTCQFAQVPNDVTGFDPSAFSGIELLAFFMRFHAEPVPVSSFSGASEESIDRGRVLFSQVGCVYCHTSTLTTGDHPSAALRNRPANLFSDLLLHNMGPGLADGIEQGAAAGDEFRTAPLWGLGQRIFFLHDGRTTDLLEVIRQHKSAGNLKVGPSEANKVIDRFNTLTEAEKQNLLNFLRSL